MDKYKNGERIVVLGAGESGVGAAVLAKEKGLNIFISDAGRIKKKYKDVLLHHEIAYEEQGHSYERILDAQEVIKSPGIPDHVPVIHKILNRGIPIISEIEFASRFTGSPKVCITGSNGKTTTTLLTGHILNKAGMDVAIVGNVGKSFAWQVAKRDADIWVIELSSFQLDWMFDFKAEIAVIMNITPDHLDRYDYQFEKYAESKFRITQNQTVNDHLIYCMDDEVVQNRVLNKSLKAKKYPFSIYEIPKANGAYLSDPIKKNSKKNIDITDNQIIININSDITAMTLEGLALQGRHNVYNSMAATIASRCLDIRKNVIKESLLDFQNIEHRLEFVARIHGIDFINDSKATNINSTWYALESMNTPVIWIAGGIDKGNDYTQLTEMVRSKVKAIVCLGVDNTGIIKTFKDDVESIVETRSAQMAVQAAYNLAEKDDIVLLSPACASFDLFSNFEERGNKFKEAVKSL